MRFQVGEDSSNQKFLLSRLFDVAEGSTVEESSSSCIRLDWNKGIVGHVAATGQPLNIRNAYQVKACVCVTVTVRVALFDWRTSDSFDPGDMGWEGGVARITK